MNGLRGGNAVLIIVAVLIVILAAFLLVRMPRSHRAQPTLRLSYHSGTLPDSLPLPKTLFGETDTMLVLTVLIPHNDLPSTMYNCALITPPSTHRSIPSLRKSKRAFAGPDTLELSLSREYFPVTPGNYTLVLNEIFLDVVPAGAKPAVYLYPFQLTAQ